MKLGFCRQIFEIYSNIKLHKKIHLVGAELFYEDGQTDIAADMTKLIVAFSNFANASKNGLYSCREFILVLFMPSSASSSTKRRVLHFSF
jgi:hypothetical protein